MKKINRIKLLFIALPIIVIALLLFMRWNDYGRSYKSLADWGTGKMGFSEKTYYSNRIRSIGAKWQQAGNKEDEVKYPNTTFLHIDLRKNALWLEEDGDIYNENYTNLPENISWQLSLDEDIFIKISSKMSSPEKYKFNDLPERTILRQKGPNEKFIGLIFLKDQSNHFIPIVDLLEEGFGPTSDINSLVVSEEEYRKYKDSRFEKSSEQFIVEENETSKQNALYENKSRWLEAEKLLYMEIDGQLQKAGYELNSLELEVGPDYTCAHAIIQAYGESAIHKLLDLGGGAKTVRAYLKIEYLGDDIWYAKTAPHPKRELKSDKKLDLEFLIFADEQIPRSKYRRYIMHGRKVQQFENFLTPKWKASLPNGFEIEIIGIKNDSEPDTWWGPDGTALNLPDFVHIEPINNYKDITLVAWQINLPEKKEGKMINFEFDSVKDIQTVSVPDRYGIFENVIISIFDNAQEKTDFKIIIKDDYETTEYIAFKNISLIKDKDQGFIIEN